MFRFGRSIVYYFIQIAINGNSAIRLALVEGNVMITYQLGAESFSQKGVNQRQMNATELAGRRSSNTSSQTSCRAKADNNVRHQLNRHCMPTADRLKGCSHK